LSRELLKRPVFGVVVLRVGDSVGLQE